MPLKGNVGAVYYIFEAAPITFDKPPDIIEQVGGVFLWELDAEQTFSRTFAGAMPETHCVTTGWHCLAEMFWGDDRFFKAQGEIAFIRLFFSDKNCIEGYIIIPQNIKSQKDVINEDEIYFEGINKPWVGGIP